MEERILAQIFEQSEIMNCREQRKEDKDKEREKRWEFEEYTGQREMGDILINSRQLSIVCVCVYRGVRGVGVCV